MSNTKKSPTKEALKKQLEQNNAVMELLANVYGSLEDKPEEAVKPQAPNSLKVNNFPHIRQGTSTNELTKIKAKNGKELEIDHITGTGTITTDNIIITIPNYEQLTGLKTSTYQLLDAICIALTESGTRSPTVTIPLSEYMKIRGLKDRKSAKEQVRADIDVLRVTSISWEEKTNGKSYSFINLADSGRVERNGDIVFTFGTSFFNIISGYPVMPYPTELFRINSKRHPYAYMLGRKIAEHKNMNNDKKNGDIISVKTLLTAANFPTYEEVMEGNRNITERIIEPFERDLTACENIFSWEYCHRNNEPLEDKELENMNYQLFENLLIHITWKNYPERTPALEEGNKKKK